MKQTTRSKTKWIIERFVDGHWSAVPHDGPYRNSELATDAANNLRVRNPDRRYQIREVVDIVLTPRKCGRLDCWCAKNGHPDSVAVMLHDLGRPDALDRKIDEVLGTNLPPISAEDAGLVSWGERAAAAMKARRAIAFDQLVAEWAELMDNREQIGGAA